MGKVKTRNRWDSTSKLTKNVEKVLKGLSVIVFLSVWVPAFVYVMLELVKYLL
jgi:hypothetical protein